MMAGILALLGAGVLWGLIGTSTRFSFRDGVTAEDIAFYRALIAGVGFLLVAWLRRLLPELRRIPPSLWRNIILFSFVGVVGLDYSNLKAVETGGAGFAAVFLYLAPFFVAVWGRLFFGERLNALKAFSLLLTVGGVALVGFYGGGTVSFSLEAILWGLLSAFSYSLFYVFSRRYFREHSPFLLNGVTFTLAAVFLAGLTLLRNGAIGWGFSTPAWGGIVFAGVFSTLFAYGLYSEGMKRIEATRASILCSIEPVVAIFSAYLVWREALSLAGYAGAALVVGGVSLSVISERENPRSA